MIISDLNHLEVVSSETNIIGGITNTYQKTKLSFKENVDVDKDFNVHSSVKGISAFAEGDAQAYGYYNHSEGLSNTYTAPGYSAATATSLSQSSPY